MIQIILEGKKEKSKRNKMRCPRCDCIFSYNDEDITEKTLSYVDFHFILCPWCKKDICLETNNNKKNEGEKLP